MKVAYLDCSSGSSGDMFAGALIDAGVPLKHIKNELSKIPLKGYHLYEKTARRCGIKATRFVVEVGMRSNIARQWNDIRKIIMSSKLDESMKEEGLRLFKRLFDVEARVHGKKADAVHLHELGAVDCIIDIFSVLTGLQYLGIKKVYSSAVNLGSGSVKTEHGELPVPSPATLSLLKNAAIYSTDSRFELTTPTGALLVSGLSDGFGGIPPMRVITYGYGAGERDLKKTPNVMRVIIGEDKVNEQYEQLYVIETNIDDMNPQLYEHVMEKLFRIGSLDVFLTNIMMKKQRPGIQLTVLVREEALDSAINTVLEETTTIGVRFSKWGRISLRRETGKINTKFGNVRFKKVFDRNNVVRIYPEYDDCRKIADNKDLPIAEVFETVKNYLINKEREK